MESSKKQVFLSYAREDLEEAERIYNSLKEKRILVWMDNEDILPGQNWEHEIKNAIRESSYFLALLSSKSLSKTGFVQKELKVALDKMEEFPLSEIYLIPVRLDDCSPVDERLKGLQWVDLFRSYEKGLNKILRVLLPHKQSQEKLQESPEKLPKKSQEKGLNKILRVLLPHKQSQEKLQESPQEKLPKKPQEWKEEYTGMEFALVKGGTFSMGDLFVEGDANEKPVHEVYVDDFYLGKYAVTQREWKKVMGKNPSHFTGNDRLPVEEIGWDDTQEFIEKLNGRGSEKFRLPSEAEWEYAAREGGKKVRFGNGKDIARSNEMNFNALKKGKKDYSEVGEDRGKTVPVGSFAPNGLGLYEMSGNIYEWVEDIYNSDIYSNSSRNNPIYMGSGLDRVIRGAVGSTLRSTCGALIAATSPRWAGTATSVSAF